jgi:predicted RNA-binding Zn-ribbon protein involved in translation (DUF1610 family)
MAYDPRCTKCNAKLITEEEADDGLCEDCADAEIERYLERRDWDNFHLDTRRDDPDERT